MRSLWWARLREWLTNTKWQLQRHVQSRHIPIPAPAPDASLGMLYSLELPKISLPPPPPPLPVYEESFEEEEENTEPQFGPVRIVIHSPIKTVSIPPA